VTAKQIHEAVGFMERSKAVSAITATAIALYVAGREDLLTKATQEMKELLAQLEPLIEADKDEYPDVIGD
jgi:hypothetical protein